MSAGSVTVRARPAGETIRISTPSLLKAGALYFALVFAVGCVLGPVRELLVTPRLGPTLAVLLETPLMLIASAAAARWIVRRRLHPATTGARLAMGATALTLLAIAELLGTVWVRGVPARDYLAGFAAPPGLVALLLFVAFAVMPLLVGPAEPRRPGRA